MNANKWAYTHAYDEYYDFDRELYRLPDAGDTSVDMHLTFNVETKTCTYTLSLHNDDGQTRDWEEAHYIPWSVGLAMLAADGTQAPAEVLEAQP